MTSVGVVFQEVGKWDLENTAYSFAKGCSNKVSRTRRLKPKKDIISVLGARSLRSGCPQGQVLPRAVRETVLCFPVSFGCSAGCHRHSLVHRCVAPTSAFFLTQHPPCVPVYIHLSPFDKDTSHTGVEPTPMTSSQFDHLQDPISK